MVREALAGCWSLVNRLTGGTAERARGVVTAVLRPDAAGPEQTRRLQERVRDLERQVWLLRAAADAVAGPPRRGAGSGS